jgi:hypothetical protein
MQRKIFLRSIVPLFTGFSLLPKLAAAQDVAKPAAIEPTLVRDFVGAGHLKFDKVKQMLAETPNLLYAAWDWGGGDFETAIEAAGHVGNKEIANYLIDKGARANLFVLTMLGKTAIVKPFLEANPAYINARGPHGFSFLHHAEQGEEDSKELLEYFQAKGLTEKKFKLY